MRQKCSSKPCAFNSLISAGEKLPQPASMSHALTAAARSASNAFLRSRHALSSSKSTLN